MSSGSQPAPERPDGAQGSGVGAVDYAKKYWWAGVIAVPVIVAGINILPTLLGNKKPPVSTVVNQDSHDVTFHQVNVIAREYQQKTGQELPPELRAQIEQGLAMLKQNRFADGIAALQLVAQKADLPSLHANLGSALALAGNSSAAQAEMARAAPGDKSVEEARQVISGLTGNNEVDKAAEISIQKPISSTLLDQDNDYFVFITPGGPRDYMRVTLRNNSTRLYPVIAALNPQKAPIHGVMSPTAPKADVMYTFPSTPGERHFVHVYSYNGEGGSYSLVIEPMRGFDEYEPNDTRQQPRDIPTGRTIEANIMDAADKDYYKFRARSAKTVITVDNRSDQLQLTVATLDADRNPAGSTGGRGPGANVRHEFATTPGQEYLVCVEPYNGQPGKYALTVQ